MTIRIRSILGSAIMAVGLALFAQGSIAQTDSITGTDDAPARPQAPRVKDPVAEFTGLDKITGRTMNFDVYMDETVQFGALQVTPRVCYVSAEDQEPKTDAFVEVDEITLDRKIRRIFTGWMLAQSPGLNAVEHPVYDVWLKTCKQKSDVPPPKDSASTPARKSDNASKPKAAGSGSQG